MTGALVRAVTGPSVLTPAQRGFVARTLTDLSPPTEFRTGAAAGADTVAALHALEVWPAARHVMFVPAGDHNFHLSEHWVDYGGERVYCEPGRTAADSYRARNTAMVADADELVAFLFRPTFYRSGEWMTVGIAGRAGVRIIRAILPPRTLET